MSSIDVKNQVTKDMTISSIIEKFPYAADSLKARGIHCVGCGVSNFETLEQGVLGHGRKKEELEEILEEINSTIEEMAGAIFVVTERASKVILETMAEEDDEYVGLEKTKYSVVRYGNVMGSRGSVLPTFVNHALTQKTGLVLMPVQ